MFKKCKKKRILDNVRKYALVFINEPNNNL